MTTTSVQPIASFFPWYKRERPTTRTYEGFNPSPPRPGPAPTVANGARVGWWQPGYRAMYGVKFGV